MSLLSKLSRYEVMFFIKFKFYFVILHPVYSNNLQSPTLRSSFRDLLLHGGGPHAELPDLLQHLPLRLVRVYHLRGNNWLEYWKYIILSIIILIIIIPHYLIHFCPSSQQHVHYNLRRILGEPLEKEKQLKWVFCYNAIFVT